MGTRAWEAVKHPAGAPAHDADLGAIWRRAETLRTVLLLLHIGLAEQMARKRTRLTREKKVRGAILKVRFRNGGEG